MQVQNNSITFTGYGARPLRGLFLRSTNVNVPAFRKISSQLEQIGQKHGFDVFVQTNKGIYSKDLGLLPDDEYLRGGSTYIWCQDNMTFLQDNKFISNANVISKLSYEVEKFFGLQKYEVKKPIPGGNYFIIDDNGQKELLLGRFNAKGVEKLVKELDVSSVKLLSQSDFHIDLFVRPLKDKTVLVADDKIWFDRIHKIVKDIENDRSLVKVHNKLKEICNKLCVMVAEIPNSQYIHTSKVQEELADAGYNVVKVPGRIFDYINDSDGILPQHILNYMNGIVHENKNGDLVYITNKSNLNQYCGITEKVAQKIGFDFQTEFVNSVKGYIKPENIYFVDSKMFLKNYEGGIHCLVAEMPKF